MSTEHCDIDLCFEGKLDWLCAACVQAEMEAMSAVRRTFSCFRRPSGPWFFGPSSQLKCVHDCRKHGSFIFKSNKNGDMLAKSNLP